MKKFLFYTFLFLILASCSGNDALEVGNKTSIEVEPIYDAGKVVKGEIIEAKIRVRNTGVYPLAIADVTTSCSCTVPEKPDELVPPGEEIIIKAQVDTEKTSGGLINKSVTIVANTEPSTTTVIIRAEVTKK
ncbi:MAG: DUF1573 domain-containing protein [Bacteroidota bacterium]|jgi:hypothetical protein